VRRVFPSTPRGLAAASLLECDSSVWLCAEADGGNDGRVRGKGVWLILGLSLFAVLGVVGFLAQRLPTEQAGLPYAVAKVVDISSTPRSVQVVMQRGYDRVLQRDRTGFAPCGGPVMGCPGTIELRPVTVFLVRDEIGAPHAFIGEDPRNGCALEWMTLPDWNWFIDGVRVEAVFHGVCHGSLYDRRGQVVGGPSPWALNALATEERGDDLYLDPRSIVIGECRGCRR
jgi:hypothetical protein